MDTRKLTELLRATIDPNQRQQAEEQLSQIHKIIGFAPSLLQSIMQHDVPIPVKQAGVVYLKNMITSDWQEKEAENGQPVPFSIHEQDRAMIRDMIVEAIVQAPDILRVQLGVCLKTIVKNDFPSRWTQIVDKIHIYLQSNEPNTWMGALLCLYQLIKAFEYQSAAKRAPLNEAMNLLLPMMYNLMVNIQTDHSPESVLIQKQILKCFYCLTKYELTLDLITKEIFTKWMEVLRSVMDQPIPEHTLQVDEDERMELPWWKCKKWAVHTLSLLFERYGSVNAQAEYTQFAEWYLTTFTGGILEVLLRVLDQYRNKVYISPRVLQQTLNYIYQCVTHAHSWKLLKPHMFAIIQDVLFPLMSLTEADEELYLTDPREYISMKFDIFNDFVSPVISAQSLLISCCKKRKDMLDRTMQLCMRVLTNQNGEFGPRQREGALHMVGTLSYILMKKKFYKEEIDSLLSQYVFPEFQSPQGYMRARACWMLHSFASARFKNEAILIEATRLSVNALLNDSDLAVKVEAAVAVQMLLTHQEKVHDLLEPQVTPITTELLNVLRETENDNIACVVQKVVHSYTPQVMHMAYEIMEHLANTFSKLIEMDSAAEENAISVMGLINTMQSVLDVMEDSPEVMARLESTVLRVISQILQNNIIEYYEEAMALLCNLTAKSISADMWKVLEMLYQWLNEKESFDYFTDMMPVLHNYITVDTEAFLSNGNHVLAMFNMAKAVFNSEVEEYTELYAAKLLEVMVLQCPGKIDNWLPSFVELVISRLIKKVETADLRTMLLQVLISILYSNPHLLFSILEKLQESVPIASITQHFLKQWIHDTDCFMGLHDKKLSVLGICTLLEMGPQRPSLDEILPKLLPSCLVLFHGLKRAYEAKAEAEGNSSSDEETDEEDEGVISSDDDDIEQLNNDYLENIARMATKKATQQGINLSAKIIEEYDSDDDDDYEPEETPFECFTTPLDEPDCPIDEYVQFKNTLTGVSNTDPALYHALTSALSEEQQKQLNDVLHLADLRKAQQDSKRIEKSGGYSFTVPEQVPSTFKFGSQLFS